MKNKTHICNFYVADLMDKMDNGGITDQSQNKQNMEIKATVLQKDVSMLLGMYTVQRARRWPCYTVEY